MTLLLTRTDLAPLFSEPEARPTGW